MAGMGRLLPREYSRLVEWEVRDSESPYKTDKQRAKEYRARKRATGWQDKRGNRHRKSIDYPFVGIDGEGGEIAGRHRYLMIRSGEQTLMHWDRSPLHTREILEWLCTLERRDVINVGFFFDYDVTQILADLATTEHGQRKLYRLMHRELRKSIYEDKRTYYWPVDWGGYEFDYLPRKEFKVRRKGEKRFFVINDVGSFFQMSFLNTLKAWKIGTEVDYETIAEGKSGRINFGELTDETIKYNGREIVLLEELMTEFRQATIAANMVPAKWQGPGQIATSIFKKEGMIKGEQLRQSLPSELLGAANAAYFGGRFETTAIGNIPGPVYQHDINSAYPYAETLLPCLVHGRWDHTDGPVLPRGLCLARGSFTATEDVNLYGLPHRSPDGSISWPGSAGDGWYWSHEIRASIHQRFDVSEAWVYSKNCDCQPFAWVPPKYEERAKLGKESKGIAIKLGLNSTYGKTCQSIGTPQYANPIYASLITSLTRTQLYSKCLRFGLNSVVMLATDGIFTTSEVDKDHSPRIDMGTYTLKPLGDWEVKTYEEGIFIIQPGLYLLPGGEKPKTRGVPQNKVLEHIDDFHQAYSDIERMLRIAPAAARGIGYHPTAFYRYHVKIPLRTLINIKLAVHTKHWGDMGQWVSVKQTSKSGLKEREGKRISFDWRSKRSLFDYTIHDGWISNKPFGAMYDSIDEGSTINGEGLRLAENTPYSKDIGAMFDLHYLNGGLVVDADSPEYVTNPEEAW